ncbi:conserved hypothetical protein [Nautilia profundicola AmH]|uniref:AAA+ ATPase domain-containing protein n=1 Tax=Nautilia profundicola (strain ATCC BAA-1463 / DSM 18972 / AmH) TaxID=598659 RepID=B9L708_NAUPA|nr:DNA/RNA helicase domain-containing protein [Nautilia profundicola]ACM92683.1 conserved hypothetical protein [Nautilia profundicola AmH]
MKVKEFLKLNNFEFLKDENTSESEFRSWQNSLPHLQKALEGLEEFDIYLEYQLPNSPERIDVVIVGESIIFIELKQWSRENIEIIDKKMLKVLGEEKLNPYLQVKGYKEHFLLHTDFKREIVPVVFMHNFEGEIYGENIFYKNEYEKLNIFLKDKLSKPSTFKYNVMPTKKLVDVVKNVRKSLKLSTLQQEVAYKAINSYKNKRNLLITGMPGSGKSVLALSLHFYFLEKSITSSYITKNATPRVVYEFASEENAYRLLLHSPNTFKQSKVAIVDEAHRLTKEQINNIINGSESAILFYDDRQIVSCEDIGNEIYNYVDEVVELTDQFRCNSSDGYVRWIDSLLYGEEGKVKFSYDFRVFDDIDEFVKACEEYNAKITAGYYWEWKSRKNKNAYDIEIGNHKWQWNMHDEKNWKKQFLWSVDESQKDKIGCIHTAQGMEFDYAGVIIGEDLRYENGKIIADVTKRASDDFTVKGRCDYDRIIKNTYRVLLTRGMKGCFVYCIDEGLREYLKKGIS